MAGTLLLGNLFFILVCMIALTDGQNSDAARAWKNRRLALRELIQSEALLNGREDKSRGPPAMDSGRSMQEILMARGDRVGRRRQVDPGLRKASKIDGLPLPALPVYVQSTVTSPSPTNTQRMTSSTYVSDVAFTSPAPETNSQLALANETATEHEALNKVPNDENHRNRTNRNFNTFNSLRKGSKLEGRLGQLISSDELAARKAGILLESSTQHNDIRDLNSGTASETVSSNQAGFALNDMPVIDLTGLSDPTVRTTDWLNQDNTIRIQNDTRNTEHTGLNSHGEFPGGHILGPAILVDVQSGIQMNTNEEQPVEVVPFQQFNVNATSLINDGNDNSHNKGNNDKKAFINTVSNTTIFPQDKMETIQSGREKSDSLSENVHKFAENAADSLADGQQNRNFRTDADKNFEGEFVPEGGIPAVFEDVNLNNFVKSSNEAGVAMKTTKPGENPPSGVLMMNGEVMPKAESSKERMDKTNSLILGFLPRGLRNRLMSLV